VDDLYKKMELLSGTDEKGRYWKIRPRTFTEVLRETDLVELADWIARELGWIRRDRDVDVGHLGELERGSSTISVGLGELECAGRVAGGDGELELEGDPGELELEGEPGELERGGDPGELELSAGASGRARARRRRARARRRRARARRRRSEERSSAAPAPRGKLGLGVSPATIILAMKLLQCEKSLNEILSIMSKK